MEAGVRRRRPEAVAATHRYRAEAAAGGVDWRHRAVAAVGERGRHRLRAAREQQRGLLGEGVEAWALQKLPVQAQRAGLCWRQATAQQQPRVNELGLEPA